MTYKNWKLMDKLDVAVRNGEENYRGFTGYIVENGDKNALDSAKDWARITPYDRDKGGYQTPIEPKVYTFENGGFTATILDSAGGSSQGGRLSFWRCEVEKDGIKFTIGVNDAILADLIKNSDISNGVIKQKLMFARKGGQPGLIHENMDAYADATADMAHKAAMKSAKKTNKWEIGGIYSSITMTDICIGEVWDTMEEYTEQTNTGWYGRNETKLRKAKNPKKVLAWVSVSSYRHKETPTDFTKLLQAELDSGYVYFSAGKPPARAKTGQLKVKKSDHALIDKVLKKREEYTGYHEAKVSGRYVRNI